MTQQAKGTKDFEVIRIDPLTRVSDTKGLEKYYRIRIKTKGGVVLDVDIDEQDFTEEKAKPILLERAKNADKILAL